MANALNMHTINHRPGAAARRQDMATRCGYWLLLVIVGLSPWGNTLRLEGEGSALSMGRGLTTILAVMVIAISVVSAKFLTAVVSRPRVLCFAAFVLLATFASLLQNVALADSLRGSLDRGGYWILMVAVLSLNIDSDKGRTVIRVFTISATLMSLVSLIDYFHLANIPGFNERRLEFRLDQDDPGTVIGRAMTGPFGGRNVLAPYLALAWAVPLMELIHARTKHLLIVSSWATALGVLTLAILCNYSRSLYITVAFGIGYAIFTTNRRRLLRLFFLVAPIFGVVVLVLPWLFPNETAVFLGRLDTLSPGKIVETGGHFRISLFMATVNDLLAHPLGMGFGVVGLGRFHLVVHSIIVEHIRPAGWLGFVLTVVFMWPVFRVIANRRNPPSTLVLSASLLGVLTYGIAHSTHNMLCGWIVIGLIYGLSVASNGCDSRSSLAAAEVRSASSRRM